MRVVIAIVDNGFDREVEYIPPYPFMTGKENDEGETEKVEIHNDGQLYAFLDEVFPEGYRVEELASIRHRADN